MQFLALSDEGFLLQVNPFRPYFFQDAYIILAKVLLKQVLVDLEGRALVLAQDLLLIGCSVS